MKVHWKSILMICKQRSNVADWIVDKLDIDIDLITYIYADIDSCRH